ncbi:amino acid exporter (threonine) [Klebsiella pneumoniae subsp. pneumoniae]|nr:amino acid exporter (threonine) [Klebsiella pneumoniae subsp. pneumoniae]
MHTLSTLFPAVFPALALSHFVALLSPGPDFFLLIGYAVRYRIRGSIGLCLGIAAGNALYIVLAIVGWGLLRQAPLLFLLIELLGAGYLLWIGSLLIRSRPATLAVESVRAARPGFGRQLLLGLGSSLLNPKNALFYLALMTSLLGPAVTLLQQTVSGLWMVSVVFFWDLLLVSAIAPAADTAPPGRHRLAARAGGGGDPDALRPVDYLAIFARPRRQAICLSIWKNSLN